jgi:hypothetical protein
VRSFSQWRIEGYFIPAKMILIANASRLDSSKLACAQHGSSVVFSVYYQFHLSGDHLRHVLQELSAHVLGKMHQRRPLLFRSLVVH